MKQADKILSEILGYYKYKVDNNLCTIEEMDSAVKAIEANAELGASIPDLARYFNKPESRIRATIARKLIDKPKRRTLYPFLKFLKIVPPSWLEDK